MLGKVGEWLKIDSLIENIEGYVEARIELAKVDFRNELIDLLVKVIFFSILGLFLFSIILFLNIGLAAIINTFLHSSYWGYFILSGFYLLLFAIVYKLKDNKVFIERITVQIAQSISKERKDGDKDTDNIVPDSRIGGETGAA